MSVKLVYSQKFPSIFQNFDSGLMQHFQYLKNLQSKNSVNLVPEMPVTIVEIPINAERYDNEKEEVKKLVPRSINMAYLPFLKNIKATTTKLPKSNTIPKMPPTKTQTLPIPDFQRFSYQYFMKQQPLFG